MTVSPTDAEQSAWSVFAASRDEAWVAGEAWGERSTPLVEHWDGSKWLPAPFPDPTGGECTRRGASAGGHGIMLGMGSCVTDGGGCGRVGLAPEQHRQCHLLDDIERLDEIHRE
jgi:hypothetical protein